MENTSSINASGYVDLHLYLKKTRGFVDFSIFVIDPFVNSGYR